MVLSRKYRFSASHRLHSDQLSREQNAQIYGKCNNPFGHGHNYVLEIAVDGAVDENTGRVIDVGLLDEYVRRHVLDDLDHRDLNADVPDFQRAVPTTENLALAIESRLRRQWQEWFGGAALRRICIEETKRNSFELTNS